LKAEGTLWRQSTGRVRGVTERGVFGFEPPAGMPDPYRLQVEHFGQCIRQGRDPLVDGREGERDLEACLAVYEAAQAAKVVRIPQRV
jgi:predicted dehydrogenase